VLSRVAPMTPDENTLQPEREQTDEGLRAERAKTDDELKAGLRSIEASAARAVDHAAAEGDELRRLAQREREESLRARLRRQPRGRAETDP